MRVSLSVVLFMTFPCVCVVTAPAELAAQEATPTAVSPSASPASPPTPEQGHRLVLGVGLGYIKGDAIDFEVVNDSVRVRNDSRQRPYALAGVAFRGPTFAHRGDPLRAALAAVLPDELIVSAKFGDQAISINSFLVGLSWRIQGQLSVMAGYSMTEVNVVSFGFQREAAEIVKREQAAHNPAFARYHLDEKGEALESSIMYDGFPLVGPPPANARLFPGDPLSKDVRPTVLLAVVVPVDFKFK